MLLSPTNKIVDKLWRLQNLYKIKTKSKKLTNLRFNRAQEMILADIQNQRPIRHFSGKSRQEGVSTLWLLWWLDDTAFHRNINTGILSHKWESLRHLWSIVKIAYKHMPENVRPILGEDNAHALYFKELESRIFISLSIRSAGIHNLHISEWCWCKDDEIKATMGATSPETNISGESTGNGIENDGYTTYMEARAKDNEFKALFLPWFIQQEYRLPTQGVPEAKILNNLSPEEQRLASNMKANYGLIMDAQQVLWRRATKKKLKEMFPQEYPESESDMFLLSGEFFFNRKKIIALLDDLKEYRRTNPIYKTTNFGEYYEPPNRMDTFIAAADTAEGARDKNVLKIINLTKKRESYTFRARCGIKQFYMECAERCREFNNAFLSVELNNTGHAVITGICDVCGYYNLFKEEQTERILQKKSGKQKINYGWRTTDITRTKMLWDLKYAIEENDDIDTLLFNPLFTIYDENLLREALTFTLNNGKYEARAGNFDDDIIATAICTQLFINSAPLLSSEKRGANAGIRIHQKSETESEF